MTVKLDGQGIWATTETPARRLVTEDALPKVNEGLDRFGLGNLSDVEKEVWKITISFNFIVSL